MRILLLISLFINSTCTPAYSFYIRGTLKGDNKPWANKVYLKTVANLGTVFSGSRLNIIDSAIIDKNGNFVFTNPDVIDTGLTIYRLGISELSSGGVGSDLIMTGVSDNYTFLLLNKKSQIAFASKYEGFNFYFKPIQIDDVNLFVRNFYSQRKVIYEEIEIVGAEYRKLRADSTSPKDLVKQYTSKLDSLMWVNIMQARKFADTISNPYVSLLISQYAYIEKDSVLALNLYNRYERQIPASPYTKQIGDFIANKFYSLPIGSIAPEFELPDINGLIVKLSDYKGKYVLIDFWAAWCKPCRAEAKETIRPLYDQLKNKGLVVIGVSQDIDIKQTIQAIEKDGANWIQLGDLQKNKTVLAANYRVEYLPTIYIIDPNGKIAAKNLRGKTLSDFITQKIK